MVIFNATRTVKRLGLGSRASKQGGSACNLRTLDDGKVERVSMDRSQSEGCRPAKNSRRPASRDRRWLPVDPDGLKFAPQRAFFTTEFHSECNDQVLIPKKSSDLGHYFLASP